MSADRVVFEPEGSARFNDTFYTLSLSRSLSFSLSDSNIKLVLLFLGDRISRITLSLTSCALTSAEFDGSPEK